MSRLKKIEKAKNEHFDVAVIGGGITGAGIFLKCCQRGLKTLLLDADDFASGTSSRSAKMIHGGLRYLQTMQISLVKEALKERENLLQLYPHLVHPLPFLMPIYDSKFAIVKMKIGLAGYDKLSKNSSLPKHKFISEKEVIEQYPMLQKKGLKGGFYYFDATTNDARLTNEVIMEGCQLGGIALNYLKASKFNREDEKVVSINCIDQLTEQKFAISSDNYISATGVWTDDILAKLDKDSAKMMLPGKGIHIVIDGAQFPEKDVILVRCTDKRHIWICPWVDGLAIVGATDTPYIGDLREPGSNQDDIDYILQNVNSSLENIQLSESDILSVFSGLRPLISEQDNSDSTKVSRDYKVWWEKENVLMIAGGKLTSFLSMADQVLKSLSTKVDLKANSNKEEPQLELNGIFESKWGRQADKVQAILKENPSANQILVAGLDYQKLDIIFFIRNQHAEKLSDVLTRRTALTYRMKELDVELVSKVANIMQQELGWTEDEKQQRIKDYQKHWQILHSWSKS